MGHTEPLADDRIRSQPSRLARDWFGDEGMSVSDPIATTHDRIRPDPSASIRPGSPPPSPVLEGQPRLVLSVRSAGVAPLCSRVRAAGRTETTGSHRGRPGQEFAAEHAAYASPGFCWPGCEPRIRRPPGPNGGPPGALRLPARRVGFRDRSQARRTRITSGGQRRSGGGRAWSAARRDRPAR
jgi:hypothetical protein